MSTDQFVIWLVSPDGYAHAGAFTELAFSFHNGLMKLGKASSVSTAPRLPDVPAGATAIVFGAHLLHLLPPLDLPENAILYNTEAFGTPPFAKALPHLQAHPNVWDFSAYNVARLREECGVTARFVPPGSDGLAFDDCAEEKDIDVLFYGSINERRRHVLDALSADGLRVHEFKAPYGKGRDDFIRRAKVVLNLHYYDDPGLFESLRVAHLLNNHALVVSENGVGQHPYDQAAVCVPYDDLVAVCRAYARCDAELRISRAKLGPMVMRRFLDTPSLLSAALAGTEPAPALGDSPTRHRPTLCLVVMGKDTAAFDAMDFYDRSRPEVDELVLIKTADAQFGGQSEIANRIASRTRCDVVGVVHADTTFAKGALSALAASAYHGQQVTGLVGITLAREYVWAKTMQAGSERRVSTLDGCSVFFPVAFMKEKGVSFDEQFASFHCGTEDFCLAAGACGIPVTVPAAMADHYSEARGTFRQPQWQDAYWKTREVLAKKWPTTKFETT